MKSVRPWNRKEEQDINKQMRGRVLGIHTEEKPKAMRTTIKGTPGWEKAIRRITINGESNQIIEDKWVSEMNKGEWNKQINQIEEEMTTMIWYIADVEIGDEQEGEETETPMPMAVPCRPSQDRPNHQH